MTAWRDYYIRIHLVDNEYNHAFGFYNTFNLLHPVRNLAPSLRKHIITSKFHATKLLLAA